MYLLLFNVLIYFWNQSLLEPWDLPQRNNLIWNSFRQRCKIVIIVYVILLKNNKFCYWLQITATFCFPLKLGTPDKLFFFFLDNFIEVSREHIKLEIHRFCEDLIVHKRQMLDRSPLAKNLWWKGSKKIIFPSVTMKRHGKKIQHFTVYV